MKIAILSTPWIPVPPQGYGGIELVVSNLSEGLVKRGHDVMLFATGDSKTSAKLEYVYPKSLGNGLFLKQHPFHILYHIHGFMKAVKNSSFDVIHNNVGHSALFFLDLQNYPFVDTLHGAYYQGLKSPSGFIEEKRAVLLKFKNFPFISISNQQRTALPELNYIKTIYNGIKSEEFQLGEGKGSYLAWFGRVTPNKGLDTAIKIAKRIGMKLKVSGVIDPGDQEYFDTVIKPLIDNNVELLGEIKTPAEKNQFLGQAKATLFPICWHEPFGIVMVESMACGTPVIAFNKGSVPEVIEDGKTGFIVNNEDQMIEALKKVDQIDRRYCREHTLSKFSIDKMVDGYLEAYNIAIRQFKLPK